jgi:Mg2+-importing ATPase
MAYLNSYYQTGLKNLLDVAVLKHADVHREMNVAQDYRVGGRDALRLQRRRMSVVVAERDQRHLLICKGAVEEVLAACTQVQRAAWPASL